MFVNTFKKHKRNSPEGFRYRGRKGSRLENLTDTIFGFSITLLIVATEVPKTYLQLQTSMYSFIGFIFSSMLLLGIWNNHRSFFLHYGLHNKFTRTLNFLFLFVLLFYIYPLKYLFSYVGTGIYAAIKMRFGDTSTGLKLAYGELANADMNQDQWVDLIVRFGLGLLCIYAIFTFLHINALKNRKLLKLNKREMFITRSFIYAYTILCAISILSIAVVGFFGGAYAPHAGFVYLLTPIAIPIFRSIRSKKLKTKVWKKNKVKKLFPVEIEDEVITSDEITNNTTEAEADIEGKN